MKISCKFIVVLTTMSGLAIGALCATEVTVTADANLYTASKSSSAFKPGEVLKTANRIVVGGSQSGYVHFTLPQDIPNAGAIKRAVLRIFLPYDDKNSQNVIEVAVCALLNGQNRWDDAGTGNPAVGAVFQPKTGAMDAVIAKVQGDQLHSNTYVEWDVTDLMKEKGAGLDGHTVSFRISMKGGVFRFNDREGNPAAGNPPQLVITQ